MAYLHSQSYGWNSWRKLIDYYRRGGQKGFWAGQVLLVCCYLMLFEVSDMCPEIAICHYIVIRTFTFDSGVICWPYGMIYINLRQYSSLGDLLHQNLCFCWPTGRKSGIWNLVWTNLYSITILRSVLYGEIRCWVCKVCYKMDSIQPLQSGTFL